MNRRFIDVFPFTLMLRELRKVIKSLPCINDFFEIIELNLVTATFVCQNVGG